MGNNLRFFVAMLAILLYFFVFLIFRKGRISFKYLLVWLLPITIILLVATMPVLLEGIMHLIGFQTISNMVTGMLIAALIFITISFTVIISGQTTKIQLLIQEVSMLNKKVNELEEK